MPLPGFVQFNLINKNSSKPLRTVHIKTLAMVVCMEMKSAIIGIPEWFSFLIIEIPL